MPIRRSEAYDDPLRHTSKTQDKSSLPHKITDKSVSLEENRIEWSNLIFLPFHPIFEMFVLISVFIKASLGPIQSVYPIVYCGDVMDHNSILIFVKYCYLYYADCFYGLDTFLHIVHRQVTDKAMRREHLPKSVGLIICDLVGLIPFFRLLVSDNCPPARVWPNILSFNEFIIIYRVTNYFNLVSTHSLWKLLVGYLIVLFMSLNCIACFWLLITEQGFCEHCAVKGNYFDWRAFVLFKLNETDVNYATYVYAYAFVFSFTQIEFLVDEIQPSAILEFAIVCVFLVCSYILNTFIVIPKGFAESIHRLRRISNKHPQIIKLIEETKRRNSDPEAYKKVEEIYGLLWMRRSGIVKVPQIFFTEIPKYLRLEIKQDILWPLYYHSPTLRKTSFPLRRWLSEVVTISYKLPGEKFFTGAHSTSSLYYLKSGIVQLISADDGATPILSVTSGTVFGDINFFVPNNKRKVAVRCLTYCEVYYVNRQHIIRALHKYPRDRRVIMQATRDRVSHAKKLYSCKKLIRGMDRNEDEGISWIKKRWWEIWEIFERLLLKSGLSREQLKFDLPHEDAVYHCAKYLGQLVLCTPQELQTKSMFTRSVFPWILNPVSKFGSVWNQIITVTVSLVLCLHPPNLVKSEIPSWFIFFSYWADSMYAIDIGVSLVTAVKKEDMVTTSFSSVLFERFKSFTFMLDILSTIWIEDLAYIVGAPEFYYTLQFNRLLKVYMLFYGTYLHWDIRKDPLVEVCRKIVLTNFAFLFLSSHIVFEICNYVPKLTITYFFGEDLCSKNIVEDCVNINPITGCAIFWTFEWAFAQYQARNLYDIYLGVVISYLGYIVNIFCRSNFVAYLYLQNREEKNYQRFVSSLKKYYQHYRIHQDLLKRLDRYLICHWNYYKGRDVMRANTLDEEPLEVYWKTQGEVAHKIISESNAFEEADHALVRELACAAKFLVLPKNVNLIMFGIQCKNVTWVVQGCVTSEYHDEKGEKVIQYYGPGNMLSVSAVFFGRPSLMSYASYTDCEILYIPIHIFFEIYKRYPVEYRYLQTCIREYGSTFDDMFKKYILKHKDYQTKLRDRIYSTRMSVVAPTAMTEVQEKRSLPFEGDFWGEPESSFMQTWLMFRTIIVFISIGSAALLGGIGAVSRWIFTMISAFCDCVAWIDIVIKLFLAYYDDRGILITNKRKCLMNYMTKAFVLDVIGAIPLYEVLRTLMTTTIDDDTSFLINTMCKFAHVYILFSYFEYISDLPTVNGTFINILKWQIVNTLIVLGSSHYFMVKCVKFEFESKTMNLLGVTLQEGCWMPDIMTMPHNLSWEHLHLIFAESLNLAEAGMMGMNFGRFIIDREHLGVGVCLFTLALMFWFITGNALTLLVLDARGDFLFQHSVNQLQRFLKSERVEKSMIKNAMGHFRYCWKRTKGIDIQQLTNDRIGLVFRQDLNYYFYKKTFSIMDTIIKGGEPMQRQLASASTQAFFLPGHDIIREMDIMSYICIVHRGRVNIYRDDKKIVVLTKGDVFGQLTGTVVRPISIRATADDKVDLLYIEIKAFHSIITDEVRKTISRNPQHKNDFLATKTIFVENPYDTVDYLLRGRKTIMLPWSHRPTEARYGSWYSYFLHLTWLIGPFVTALGVNTFNILPTSHDLRYRVYILLFVFDVVHLINFIAEFYTIELVVVKQKCVHRRVGAKKFKYWGLYLDLLTFIVPFGTLADNDWRYQLARMFRLKYFYDFELHFCRSFKSRITPVLLKLAILILVFHVFTCGWITIACRNPNGEEFPIKIRDMRHMTTTVDFTQWMHPDDRREGCARATGEVPEDDDLDFWIPTFVVPKYWPNDYIVSLTYVLIIYTQTNINTVLPVSIAQVYYKVFITFVMQLLHIYIMARAINAAYTKYRELYLYDHDVQDMLIYLTDNGLCRSLSDSVLAYTLQLWDRQKGDKLPLLAYQGPPCLRQDLFTSLYIHHLEAPPTFRQLPFYFKRQLAARFQRIVVFPGKCIVREGDNFNITYFIHEGEVEKWYNESSGESKLLSVLYTNGYFGCIAGLFVNMGFEFSYYSRTVVDLVFLDLDKWTDLLECYPEVKAMLYEGTKHSKGDPEKHK